jgi:hypothetical protein
VYLIRQFAPRLCHGDQPRSVVVIRRSLSETKALGCMLAEFIN